MPYIVPKIDLEIATKIKSKNVPEGGGVRNQINIEILRYLIENKTVTKIPIQARPGE